MIEEIIPLDLAKILKKKNFLEESFHYDANYNIVFSKSLKHRNSPLCYPAPTKEQLNLWLMEEYELYVYAFPQSKLFENKVSWTFSIAKLNPKSLWEDIINHTAYIYNCKDYEEAMYEGFKEVLNKLGK